jgi:outer membrane immunogenic protein
VSDKFDTLIIPGGALFASDNSTRWGETVGAGLEIGFAQNWSIGAEYNHIFMDSYDAKLISAGAVVGTERIRQDVDMGLIRLNYRFGGPVIAKY